MRYRIEVAPEAGQWLRELCAADAQAARLVGAAVTALLTAGTGLGEPLVVTMSAVLLTQDPDPDPILDHAYRSQLELLQQVRRGIADIASGHAGPPQEEQRLTRLGRRLQREVDRFRFSKEVAKAVHQVGRVTVEVDAYLASRGATDLTDPDAAAGLASARAGVNELLATAEALDREVRSDPFLAARLSPAPPPPAPLRGGNLHELRPGRAGDGEIRIVFAVAPEPERIVVLFAAEQRQDDLWLWYRQVVPAAEQVMAEWSSAGGRRQGRGARRGYSARSFLKEFFPGRAGEVRAGAARLLAPTPWAG